MNFCQRNGYTDFKCNPTQGLYNNIVAVRQNWLSPDEMRMIRDCKNNHKAFVRFRDLFMLSYYLGGINLIDLGKIDFNECKNTIHYI